MKKKTREYTWNEELGKILDNTLSQSIEARQHDRNEFTRSRAKRERESSRDVPPIPPMNLDGSFKSIEQLVSADKVREWEIYKADAAKVAQMNYESANDPEQLQWEQEMGIGMKNKKNKKVEYELVIPDSVKIIIFIVLLVSSVIGMMLTW